MDLIKGTPCEAAIEKAMQLARQILAGEIDAFVGGRQIAGLGSVDCYDFLNEVDVVDEMGGGANRLSSQYQGGERMSAAIAHLEHDDQAAEREFRWLLLFLHPAEIEATLTQNPIRLRDRRPTHEVLAELRQRRASLEPYVMESVQALPPSIVSSAHEVQARDVYQREYASKCDVNFGLAPLFALLAPQPLADMDYVAELGGSLSPEPNEVGDFTFCFPEGSVPEPAVIGNTVMFSTPAPNVYVSPVPTYRAVAGGYEVVARVEPRPNYLFVAQVLGLGGRLMLINGVHHALALIRAGRRYAPVILRQAMALEELGLPPTSLLAQAGAPRPPLVRDFLGDCAVLVRR